MEVKVIIIQSSFRLARTVIEAKTAVVETTL